ncbi:39S ribosomal protein L27 [Gryllus bimaculatus]|nr:39S ribosomal protein L27 [Gryllus bimaculatus]
MASFCNVLKKFTILDWHSLANVHRHDLIRWASKKAGGSTRNRVSHGRPKHLGIKLHDGAYATAGSRIVTQIKLRFHPGLHVGFGKNGTLFAMESGRVVFSCEKIDPKWEHTWIERIYAGRVGQTIYKKFVNIIPDKQHNRFKLIDQV